MPRPPSMRAALASVVAAARSFVVTRRLTLGVGLCAAAPVIASVVRALSEHWLPYDDRGLGAVRAYDVFSSHPPLVGTHAAYSLPNRPSFSPGPLHYWLFAVPVRIGPAALVLAVGLVNLVAVMAVVALAERRGGRAFMLLTGAAVALMAGSLPTEALHDTWEPYLTILPFTLLILLCWSVAGGEHRLLPVTVLVASFVVECHVAYLPGVLAILAIAGGGLAWTRSRRPAPQPRLRRTLVAAGAVWLVCWSAPLLDQAIHRPGNLATLVWYALHRGATVGAAVGWRAVVRVVGIPPWWLRTHHDIAAHFRDLLADPAALAVASSIAILIALALVAMSVVRTRDAELAFAAAMALALCASVALVATSTPKRDALAITLGYTIDWGSPVGMWAWLTLALALLRHAPAVPARSVRLAAAGGIAAVVSAAAFVAASGGAESAAGEFRPMRTLAQRVEAAVRGAHVVHVDFDPTWTAYEFTMATVYALRRDGLRPTLPLLAVQLGGWYDPRRARPDRFLWIRATAHRPGAAPPGTIRVATNADTGNGSTIRALSDVVVRVTRTPVAHGGAAGGRTGPPAILRSP